MRAKDEKHEVVYALRGSAPFYADGPFIAVLLAANGEYHNGLTACRIQQHIADHTWLEIPKARRALYLLGQDELKYRRLMR